MLPQGASRALDSGKALK